MIKNLAKTFCDVTGISRYWVRSTFFELRMLVVRVYSILPIQSLKVRQLAANKKPINIIFGCGDTKYEGWIGIDCFFSRNVDLVLDLRRKLPFKSHSVDLCYSEHFVEHLCQNELIEHLNEVLRVLKPSGRYRIVAPAALRFVEKYIADDHAFFALAFPWAARPMDAVRDIIYFSGDHRNFLDFKEMEFIGKQVGFERVIESSANSSNIEILKIDKNDRQRVAESFYVEMVKSKF